VVEKLEDILTRFGNKIAAGDLDKAGQGTRRVYYRTDIPPLISSSRISWTGHSRTTATAWSIRFSRCRKTEIYKCGITSTTATA
jgi:hypothetical protein